jgi:hypothetical protein
LLKNDYDKDYRGIDITANDWFNYEGEGTFTIILSGMSNSIVTSIGFNITK